MLCFSELTRSAYLKIPRGFTEELYFIGANMSRLSFSSLIQLVLFWFMFVTLGINRVLRLYHSLSTWSTSGLWGCSDFGEF